MLRACDDSDSYGRMEMAPHASITLTRTVHTYSLTQSEERELGGTKYTRNTSKPYVAVISQASHVV